MQLIAEKREITGKKVSALRAAGHIPAELYGHGSENVHITVPAKDLLRLIKSEGHSSLVDLVMDGKPQRVLMQDVQTSVHDDAVIHVDFYAIRKGEKITTHVPISFVGESSAVKAEGGVLNKNLHEIEVEALPDDLPHEIEVDLSVLAALDTSIYVKDLKAAKGVEFKIDPETVIVSVSPPRVAEEAPAATEAAGEVKVEGDEKKAARDAKKEGEEKAGE
jgi:large subunit ribosomal protein L25